MYNNEPIDHSIFNRGLRRLWDNDVILMNGLRAEMADVSATLSSEIEALDVRVTVNEADIAALQGSLKGEWDSVYDSVNALSARWTSTHETVNSTSGLWDSSSFLSGLADVNINPAVLNTGDQLQWSNAQDKWIRLQPSEASGVNAAQVSGIVENYDAANGWSVQTTYVANNRDDLDNTIIFTRGTSAFNDNQYNALIQGKRWVWNDPEYGVNEAKSNSILDPYLSGEYVVDNEGFGTSTAFHDELQKLRVLIRQNENLIASLVDQDMSVNGTGGGGTAANLYLQLYVAADNAYTDAGFPGESQVWGNLPEVDGCTFGFSSINITNSYTTFVGLQFTTDNTFAGTVNQVFYFKDCYIDLDQVTVSNALKFVFDNGCTVDPGTASLANLDIVNRGIPTYVADPNGATFNSFSGGYILNNALSGFANVTW
jgi:hypothetical protein